MTVRPLRVSRTKRVGSVANQCNVYLFAENRDDARRRLTKIIPYIHKV